MKNRKLNVLLFFLYCGLLVVGELWAQGPKVSYYYNPATDLSFASCYLYQHGGSQQKIPFLPVINRSTRSPLGTNNYSRDIDVKGLVVFVGNGIVKENLHNSYVGLRSNYTPGEIDIEGKIAMFCYDFPDSIEKEVGKAVPLSRRISEASSRKASAVILFSYKEGYPFLYCSFQKESGIEEIPVITITKDSALNILLSAGRDGESIFEKWEKSGKPARSEELISKVAIKINGNFDKVEARNFLFRFRKEFIPKGEMKKLVQINEKAVKFLLECFKDDEVLIWKKLYNVYFRDFDSKLFYTHHWGRGLATGDGVYMVHEGGVPNFGLAVHENAHILTYLNWSGNSTSFLNEGIAKYAEALATDKDKNHLQTIQFLKEGNLFPLEEMVSFYIGREGLKTQVGYPASGSFVGFLLDTHGLKSFKEVFVLEGRPLRDRKEEGSWEKVYGKFLSDLEKEWLSWLAQEYNVERKYIQSHLNSRRQKR